MFEKKNEWVEFQVSIEGEPDQGWGAVCSFARVLAVSLETDAPAWPLPSERAHQDALWFCSGGDQLL